MSPLPRTLTATTLGETVQPGDAGPGGYRRLAAGAGEAHLLRRDLGGAVPGALRPLVSFVQVSDLHVTDPQSPARAEFLDRFGDDDSPLAALVGSVGLYRPQEALTVQVVEAMCAAVARLEHAPVTRAPLAFAVSTGDATDNCQDNELSAYLGLLDGGTQVTTDAGDRGRYEGVGAPGWFDPRYWHPDGSPEGEPPDRPRSAHGFPLVPGLLEAALAPVAATGIGLAWYAVHGNHDALFGGTLPHDPRLADLVVGAAKPVGLDPGVDPWSLLEGNETAPPATWWGLLAGPGRRVTPDPGRRAVTRAAWIDRHLASPGAPRGHGLAGAPPGCAYFGFDAGPVRFLALDTVNPAGGWQGSLDEAQLAWLEDELDAVSATSLDPRGRRRRRRVEDRLVVVFGHHPLETLTNHHAPDGRPRRLGADLAGLLARYPNVVCLVNGHTHANTVRAIRPGFATSHPGFWQVTTASHVDWPQQARIVEIAVDAGSGDVVVCTTMLDHAGRIDPRTGDLDEVATLAGWSRELSANAWQGRRLGAPAGRGEAADRNLRLVVPAPFALRR